MSILRKRSNDTWTFRHYHEGRSHFIGNYPTFNEAEYAQQVYKEAHPEPPVMQQIRDEFECEYDIQFKENRKNKSGSKFRDPKYWNEKSAEVRGKIMLLHK